jgi:DNA-binding response OmpR family regulator
LDNNPPVNCGVLLVAGNLFSFGWSGTGNNWGMMGGRYHPGMMGGWGFSPFGWLFGLAGMFLPLGLLALLIMGVVWLVQQVTQARPSAGQNCANCGRAVQSDWQLCPHCGHAEAKIARTVRLYLEQAGYQVATVEDGALAMPAFRHEQPDLIILDLMLPHVDGWELCRQIRRESGVPIIMLTARNEETDRIIGLELGADDYIAKPFSPREVVARVRAVLRRSRGVVQPPQLIRTGDLVIDLGRHEVTVAGQTVELTPLEFDLLVTFARHPGHVFTRLRLLEQVEDTATVTLPPSTAWDTNL